MYWLQKIYFEKNETKSGIFLNTIVLFDQRIIIMKKIGITFRSILGVRQEDMALLLNISRAHWSMYEMEKRK